jgi:hypothetical protein
MKEKARYWAGVATGVTGIAVSVSAGLQTGQHLIGIALLCCGVVLARPYARS